MLRYEDHKAKIFKMCILKRKIFKYVSVLLGSIQWHELLQTNFSLLTWAGGEYLGKKFQQLAFENIIVCLNVAEEYLMV